MQNNAKDHLIDVDINDVFHSTMNPGGDAIVQSEDTYYLTNGDGEIESNSFEEVTQKIFNASIEEIERMDPQFVTIIKMKNFKNMTLREIALNLGMTESKVKNIYYKNKEVLRQRLTVRLLPNSIIIRQARRSVKYGSVSITESIIMPINS